MQIDCHSSAKYKLSWHSLAPLVKIKTISTAGGGGTPYNGLYGGDISLFFEKNAIKT